MKNSVNKWEVRQQNKSTKKRMLQYIPMSNWIDEVDLAVADTIITLFVL